MAFGIISPPLWPNVPSPRDRFPEAHRLAAELLTLPRDHRYDEEDRERVARAVRELAGA
jgi:dTDP-4-amino-4,6-dideoxygalactose transaminase